MRCRTSFGSPSAAWRAPLVVAALAAIVASGAAIAASNAIVAKTYPDPVGDQRVEARCGDIRGITVSYSRGVIGLTVNIQGFKCGLLLVTLDTVRADRMGVQLVMVRVHRLQAFCRSAVRCGSKASRQPT